MVECNSREELKVQVNICLINMLFNSHHTCTLLTLEGGDELHVTSRSYSNNCGPFEAIHNTVYFRASAGFEPAYYSLLTNTVCSMQHTQHAAVHSAMQSETVHLF